MRSNDLTHMISFTNPDFVSYRISYVWSGGFVNHWFEERLFLSRLQTHSLRPANNRLVVLTMQHLGLGFVILGGGLLCATIAFIGEVVTRCFKKEEVRVLTE